MTRVLKLMFTEWLFSVVNTDTVYELERQIAKNYSIGGSCIACQIKVITKLPNSEQSYKGKVKTHNYINR